MKIEIITVGILKKSPEKELIDHYLKQLTASQIKIIEIDQRKFKTLDRWQAEMESYIQADAYKIFLDETGKNLKSTGFADIFKQKQLENCPALQFFIGGADGFEKSFLQKNANMKLSLGQMTWPHMLARVMIIEQIYRAIQILAGHPYHRD